MTDPKRHDQAPADRVTYKRDRESAAQQAAARQRESSAHVEPSDVPKPATKDQKLQPG